LDKSNVSQIASSMGESEQSVARGLESSIASVLGAMAAKAEDSGALRKMLDLAPEESGDISWSRLASGLTTPALPWLLKGKQILSGLFGNDDTAVADAVGQESGIRPGTATTLLAMAAPMVLRSLNRRVSDEGWSMRDLGNILVKEGNTIRSALPPGLTALLWPHRQATTASPIIAQSVQPEKNSSGWLGAVCLAALMLGSFWLWNHIRKPAANIGAAVTGEATRLADDASRVAELAKRRLPNGVYINVPPQGLESQLVGVIEGPDALSASSWLVSDRLSFDSGSSMLPPKASAELDNVAAILKAYPGVSLRIAGYTDSTGSEENNLDLSRARAESVKAALVSRGISPDRLATEGFGEQVPAADDTSESGRAQNRRVCLQVTEK
jgi:outer membrane protein OmpA-like peptidoglycan-associated protein